ncbi:ABC transporter substrate-binding protein [Hwanghaeella grinnelliae]|nr:ABC transporter substrate-binding protein [Hwanghaeella grinnelliae]
MRFLCAFFLYSLIAFATMTAAFGAECRTPKVLMSLPDRADDPFWGPYARFAEAVAESLNVELTVDYSIANDRSNYRDRLQAALSGRSKPDYVAVFPYFGAVETLMEESAAHGVSIITLNSDLGAGDRKAVGYPRERYKNWILQSLADDENAGFKLAQVVARAGRERFKLAERDTVSITALGGNQLAGASLYRRDGLERFVRMSGGAAAINQFVFTDWSYERGKEVAVGLIRRYPNTQGVWAANLPLGLAVADALNALAPNHRLPAIGMVSGPFDDRALDGIDEGKFAAVVGGHFLEGGIVLALLLDHFNGLDFVDDMGTALRVPFKTADRKNVAELRAVMGDRNWLGMPFRHLSKCYNGGLDYYDFNLDTIFRH